jgi:hypothetical protein
MSLTALISLGLPGLFPLNLLGLGFREAGREMSLDGIELSEMRRGGPNKIHQGSVLEKGVGHGKRVNLLDSVLCDFRLLNRIKAPIVTCKTILISFQTDQQLSR